MNCKKAKLLSALLLITFTAMSLYASGLKTSAPVVKRKPIMTIEYEYSRSGRITARKINGQVQNYKYDRKGQLLGVYDDKGNAIEEYVYDPAGNILKKTIHGRTTTYKYDKANQLVSSKCNGKVTKYEYDAAGRLVKEGDKEYHYIGLDKIESVTENGRRLSSFTYHIDGQLAARVSIESSEEFQWDGLALIQRNSTSYVNEPAVTGGNPILADDKVLFNDMLGTTLGVKDGDKVMQNNLTAFGAPTDHSSLTTDHFFTGKPHVGEMGYVFLFRAYRADQGKWQTADPLGYPDGWNNFAYVNNDVIMNIDWLGASIYELLDREGAGGNGHSLPIATKRNEDGTWSATGYNYGGYSSGSGTATDVKSFSGSSERDAINKAIDYYDPSGNKYDNMYGWQADNQKSQAAMDAMAAAVNEPYSAQAHNCLTITKEGLAAAGVYKEDGEWRPNQATEMRSNSHDFTDLLKQLLE